jgi:transcriptional regulator with XRE-family HTH domain
MRKNCRSRATLGGDEWRQSERRALHYGHGRGTGWDAMEGQPARLLHDDAVNPLQRLVRERRAELGLSLREAAEQSRGGVSAATISIMERGEHSGVASDRTLRGLSRALKLPLGEVREAAGKSAKEPVEFRLPKEADRLTDQQRRVVLKMVEALLEANARD